MPNFSIRFYTVIFLAILACFLVRCASVQQPTGGARDKEAPKVVSESPANLSTNFTAKKIEIEFNEFFKLSNEFKEISISPAMEKNPEFKVRKKVLEILFKDSLEKNTTYTINFGKGIVDYNEGNILKNYSYVFATGKSIDSLQISGNVTNTVTNKPEIESTVFILPLKQDTLFGKKRANIFTTTDSSGNFVLHNLRADTYKIYALKENGGDRIYNSTNEAVGFQKEPIILSKNISNIQLKTFNEEPPQFRILERKLLADGHFLFTFNKALTNPNLKLIDPAELDRVKKVEFNEAGDSALVWLPEITFDSIAVAVYNKEISLDTIILRRNKKDAYNTQLTLSDNAQNSKIRQKNNLVLTLSAPVANADVSKITLLEDSVPKPFNIEKDSSSLRKYYVAYPWRNRREYIFKVGENSFTSISGGKNKAYTKKFILDAEDNYTNLTLNIIPPDTVNDYIIQLLSQGTILKTETIKGNKKLNYQGVSPGKYSVRVIYDLNKNGRWDTGNVKNQTQPEPIWNYDSEITLRINLDDEEQIKIPKVQ